MLHACNLLNAYFQRNRFYSFFILLFYMGSSLGNVQNSISLTKTDLQELVNTLTRKPKATEALKKKIFENSPDFCNISNICTNLNDNKLCSSTSNGVAISGKQAFEEACPSLIELAMSTDCTLDTSMKDELLIVKKPTIAWISAIGASIIINLCALNGLVVFAFIKTNFFQRILIYLLSMAVGVLSSNALLHLLPNSLGIDPMEDIHRFFKFVILLVGIFSFLAFQILLKSLVSWNRGVGVPNLTESCCQHQVQQDNRQENHQFEEKIESDVIFQIKDKPFYQPVFLTHSVSSCASLILLGDAVHNFIDGLVIGSSFAESFQQGVTVSLAIFCEEFAHELGDFAALVNSGMSMNQSMFWNLMATSTNLLGSIIGLLIGTHDNIVTYIEAYCAGMFLYISLVVMLPEIIIRVVDISCGCKQRYITNVLISFTGILIGILLMLGMAYVQKFMIIQI